MLYNLLSLSGPSPTEPMTTSHFLNRDSPNLEGQVPVFISPRNRVAQLYPLALRSFFVASYNSQRLRRRYSNPPPHGSFFYTYLCSIKYCHRTAESHNRRSNRRGCCWANVFPTSQQHIPSVTKTRIHGNAQQTRAEQYRRWCFPLGPPQNYISNAINDPRIQEDGCIAVSNSGGW
jgi:hypothetical protein